jgi:hypothetical protein
MGGWFGAGIRFEHQQRRSLQRSAAAWIRAE